MEENSSVQREKKKILAELQDSNVYFFNQLRKEIEMEDRYSMLLPNGRAIENVSFVDRSELL